jgi:peptide subunit release factor RF-3
MGGRSLGDTQDRIIGRRRKASEIKKKQAIGAHPNSGITTLHSKVTTLYGTLAGRVATRKNNGFSST